MRSILVPADRDAIGALVRATDFFTTDEVAIAVELVDANLADGEDSGYTFVVEDDAEGVVAYACFGAVPGTKDSWDLYWIAVHPRAQRGGFGERLLRSVEHRVRQGGGARLWVDTAGRAQYAPTRAFYEKHGYHVAAVLECFYAPDDDKVVYLKKL